MIRRRLRTLVFLAATGLAAPGCAGELPRVAQAPPEPPPAPAARPAPPARPGRTAPKPEAPAAPAKRPEKPKPIGDWAAPAPPPPERPREALLDQVRTDPEGPQTDAALYGLAQYAFAARDYPAAVRRLRTLQQRFPLSPLYAESEYLLGLTLQASGDHEKAWLPLRGSLSREGDPKRRAILHAALGEVYDARSDPFAALLAYADALSEDPGLPGRGLIVSRLAALAEGTVAMHQLILAADRFAQKAAGPHLRLSLARRAEAEGRPRVALAAVRRFLDAYPDHPGRPAAETLEKNLRAQLSVNQGRIGVLLPLSGPAAAATERVYQGIQVALRHTLEENPRLQIQLAVRDTRSAVDTPGDAAVKAAELIEQERVVALIGPFLSLATEAAGRTADRFQTPLLTPFAIRIAMGDQSPWVFRNSLTNRLQSQGIAAYAVQELGLRRFAVIYPEDRDGRELAEVFTDSVRRLGGRVAKLVSFPPLANDFGAQMRALGGMDDTQVSRRKRALGLKKNDPFQIPLQFEALFVPAYHDKAVLIAPQVPFYNMHGIRLLGTHGWNNPQLLKYGERYVEGAIFVDGFFPESEEPRVARFVSEFTQLFGRKPDIFAALGYDAARIVFAGLAKGAKTREAMREHLAKLRGFDGLMGLTDMGADRDAQRQLFVLTVRRKKIIHLQMITPHRALPPAARGDVPPQPGEPGGGGLSPLGKTSLRR